jgi:hypothetical protein
MTEKENKIFRGSFKFSRVPSSLLSRDDFKKLFNILKDKTNEAVNHEFEEFQQPKDMSDIDFQKIKDNIKNNFKLSVHIFGTHGENISSNDESVFEVAYFPEDIRLIAFENFTFLKNLNYYQKNTLDIKLDFSKTNILDFSNLSKETPNLSEIKVTGNNETWVTGVYQTVLDFLKEKKRKRNWLHTKFIYNFVLFLIILPATFWTIFRIDRFIRQLFNELPNVLTTAIYVYIFFLILFIFGILFNYLRWVFPLLEFKRMDGSKMSGHRGIFLVIFLGLITIYIADIIRAVFSLK